MPVMQGCTRPSRTLLTRILIYQKMKTHCTRAPQHNHFRAPAQPLGRGAPTSLHDGRLLTEHRGQAVVDGALLGDLERHALARLRHHLGRPVVSMRVSVIVPVQEMIQTALVQIHGSSCCSGPNTISDAKYTTQ